MDHACKSMVFFHQYNMALISFYNPATRYRWFNIAWISALLLFPIILWLIPSDFFDHGTVSMCPSKLFFDFECLGCGLTRAVTHFHHFEYADAIYFNQGIVVVYPALVIVWGLWLWKAWKRERKFASGKMEKVI